MTIQVLTVQYSVVFDDTKTTSKETLHAWASALDPALRAFSKNDDMAVNVHPICQLQPPLKDGYELRGGYLKP